jgi:hypothetical protein
MPTTLQQLRDATYNILNENQDSTTYPSSLVDTMINMAELKICNGSVTKYSSWEVLEPGALPFLYATEIYSTVLDISLATATTIGATTLTVNTTANYPTSGTLWIEQNIVTYTGKTPTTFTGCSWVEFPFTAGTSISLLFSMPTDYMNAVRVTYDRRFQLDYKDYRNLFLDMKSFKSTARNNYFNDGYDYGQSRVPCYTIIQGQYLLPVNINSSARPIVLQYNKLPTLMTLAANTCTVPDRWSLSTIPYVAVAEMFYNRGEEQRGMMLNDNFGYSQVRSMYDFYNKQHTENIFGQRIVSYKDGNFNI